MAGKLQRLSKTLQRKRIFNPEQLESSRLNRCLTCWDLTALGLGSTLGVGVYVLVGSVALRVAGPSIVLSFLIAAVASMFAGLCYAELGSRVPKSGSAFIYTYVTVGELAAFLVGWNMILEALFGTASVAKGLSSYIDSMTNGTLTSWFRLHMPINSSFFSPYFDLLSCALVLSLGVLLAIGVRESSIVNNVFATINMSLILFIIIAGAINADASNWSIPESDVPANFGVGGFFPYGVWGTIQGAALCFYGFVGFDVISATGEEVKEPRRMIPQAILTVLCIVLVVYASVATVVTMMVPYYKLDRVAAVATAFSYVDWEWARWVVLIGACFGISASMFGSMFPLPRLLYSMAADGLLHHWFGYVLPGRKTPIVATLVPAVLISVLSAVIELDQLIVMMCIGTLLSYTFVAVCVVLLRYRSKVKVEGSSYLKQAIGCGERATPTQTTSRLVIITLILYEAHISKAAKKTTTVVSQRLLRAIEHISNRAVISAHPTAQLISDLSHTNVMGQPIRTNKTVRNLGTANQNAVSEHVIPSELALSFKNKMNDISALLGMSSMWRAIYKIQALSAVCTCVATALVASNTQRPLVPVALLHAIGLLLLIVITLQPQNKEEVDFKTPLVPVIPCLSIYVNIHLMILVNLATWLRVIVWMLLGIPVYALCIFCYKRKHHQSESQYNHSNQNGKAPVQIVVEAPTPPNTLNKNPPSNTDDYSENLGKKINIADTPPNVTTHPIMIYKIDEIIVQEAYIENNEEKEAKIIDLLDQVLQAEEDSYNEEMSLDEEDIPKPEEVYMVPLEISEETGAVPHRKSFSELSDAGSEASLTNHDTKYSVIAQVHREDLPKVNEEEEKHDQEQDENGDAIKDINESFNDVTNETSNEHISDNEFDHSETNSRTDESGYSDTLDKNALNDSIEDNREDIPRIPTPPPLDESFFDSPFLIKKSYSIPARPLKLKPTEFDDNEEENKPRESVQSNTSGQSQDDGNIVFGSSRQMRFMSKLNVIFQNKITTEGSEDEKRQRSNSTGDVTNTLEQVPEFIRERPSLFLDLKKELVAMLSVPNLRPVDKEIENREVSTDIDDITEDSSMSRENLKSKLETIFATGGPKLLKPRLMKSNPPTPEEVYQMDSSSTESIAKVPKVDKNDTLKRQKDKFGAVLNSFRMSLNKDDNV